MSRGRTIICNVTAACLVGLSAGCFSAGPATADSNTADREAEALQCIVAEDANTLADQVLQLVNLERVADDEGLGLQIH